MTGDPHWRPSVVRWLQSLEQAVLLKTEDPIQTLERGGDLDLFVRDPAAARESMVRELGEPLFRARYGHFYEWGHIDLIETIAWRGAELLEIEATLATSRKTAEGLCVAGPAANALLFWLRPILWGGFFTADCEPLVARALAEDIGEFRRFLVRAFGPRLAEKLLELAAENRLAAAAEWTGELRSAFWRRQFTRRPVRTLATLVGHLGTELALRIRPPLPWVAILGPDGSGKSTVLEEVSRLLEPAIPRRRIFHWRPGLLRPGNPDAGPVTDPHGQTARGLATSVVKLFFLLADWWLGYWIWIAPLGAKLTLSLFDRCYPDLLVDPRRYRYGGPMSLARWIGRLLPRPALLILLDAPAEVLQSRKQEVPSEETRRQRDEYRALVSSLPHGRVVNADRPIPQVVEEIRDLILQTVGKRGTEHF